MIFKTILELNVYILYLKIDKIKLTKIKKMPKNKGSGGKKFKKNKVGTSSKAFVMREDEDEYYGIVTKTLGNCRFIVNIICKKTEIMCTLKKSIRSKMYICHGVVVLLSVRSYQQDHGDIIYSYDNEETRALVEHGEIPASSINKDNDLFGGNDGNDGNDEKNKENDNNDELDYEINNFKIEDI